MKFIREDLPDQHREMVIKRFMREVVTLEKLDNHHLPKACTKQLRQECASS